MKQHVWRIAALALVLAGCTGQPLVKQREVAWQDKLQTAAHWDVMAETLATRVLATLKDDPVTQPSGYVISGSSVPMRPPIFIQTPDTHMPFARAFHDLLMKEFLERGAVVVSSPAGAVTVAYDVQFLAYNGRPLQDPYVPGTFTVMTTLGAIGWQAAENWSDSSVKAGLFALGPVLDGLAIGRRILAEKPNAEVLVTTTVMDGTRYVMRSADLYYVSQNDAPLYAEAFPTRPALRRAAAPAEPTTVRPVRIVTP
jgi:hypothetical protein